jgi:hypothetical protein
MMVSLDAWINRASIRIIGERKGTKMEIEITIIDGMVHVTAPFNEDFVSVAHNLKGKWDRDLRVWKFKTAVQQDVERALDEIFGHHGDGGEAVTLTVTVNSFMKAEKSPVKLGPYVLSRAYGRDSGARTGDDVAIIQGKIRSGGSRAKWTSCVEAETVFKIMSVPASTVKLMEKEAEEKYFTEDVRKSENFPWPEGAEYSWDVVKLVTKPEGCVIRHENGREYYFASIERRPVLTIERCK